MDHVEMVETHKSMEELSQPPLSSFGMRGDLSMHHSICLRRNFGEEYAHVNNVSFDYCFHYFTMHMQAMTPRRSILP